ncbi:MAG TPA: hypothetical protein PK760_07430, partial [Flavobacteriales bacterium]|nr:hypothetical protein [Flavobacteriales bacterium]
MARTLNSWTLVMAEIVAAEEQPAEQRIGHESQALHTREVAVRVERVGPLDRIEHRTTPLTTDPHDPQPVKPSSKHSSLQLLFPHDLKIVSPQELYSSDPVMQLADAHVGARYADARTQDSSSATMINATYTAFMDEALGRFVHNDHKACLEDMRFLLKQYPDDVNALFYAGLCCYNLGLYDRARDLLHRASVHPIDVFDEEAAWYHALTLDKLGETRAAQEAYARIAANDGFYSELAKKRVTQ